MTKDEAQRSRWTFYEAVKFRPMMHRGHLTAKIEGFSAGILEALTSYSCYGI
jgi:hypothetical protein